MGDNTKIEWTDATWNPVTGCTLVDEGCRHCYAAHLITSWPALGNHPSRHGLARKNATGESKFTGEVRFNAGWLDQPLRWKKPRRIFVCAHGDLFHPAVPDEWIDQVFAVMALCPQHTFQVLTKRPERALEYLEAHRGLYIGDEMLRQPRRRIDMNSVAEAFGNEEEPNVMPKDWPLPNVWLGTSISDQASADLRIPQLLACPAAVRFVSAEPLLGPVVLDDMCDGWKFYDVLRGNWWHDSERSNIERGKPRLDWVIVGGESGPHARPMHPDHVRSLRDQCVAAGVAFHFKQWGEYRPPITPVEWELFREGKGVGGSLMKDGTFGNPFGGGVLRVGKKAAGRLLDGRTWDQMPEVAA